MLKKYFTRYMSYHISAIKSSLKNLSQNSLATTCTSVVIAISLTLPALFLIFILNVQKTTALWAKEGHISLYLQNNISERGLTELITKLKASPDIASVVYKSPMQGLEELQQQEGLEDIMEFLPRNPLPPVIEVIPSLSLQTPYKLEVLFTLLKTYPFVEQAKMDIEWIKKIDNMLKIFDIITKILIFLLAPTVILIIGNTLRLTIQNHFEEIRVLKLIGASEAFIARPFLYCGILFGLLGAFFACFFIYIATEHINAALSQIAYLFHINFSQLNLNFFMIFLIFTFAALLGWIGAKFSVHRQISSIEPYN